MVVQSYLERTVSKCRSGCRGANHGVEELRNLDCNLQLYGTFCKINIRVSMFTLRAHNTNC